MSYRALVIEDDAALSDVLRMKLERDGHGVTIATSQQDAYHLLDDQSFDFALLDLRLPTHVGDMDPHSQVGFDILGHIRARFTTSQLPIVVMTAFEETSQTAVRALRAGANDYITKPFDDSQISLDDKLADIVRCIEVARQAGTPAAKQFVISFSLNEVRLNGVLIDGKAADLLRLLGSKTLMLSCTGDGAKRPHMPAKDIAKALSVQDTSVRKYVSRFRKSVVAMALDGNWGRVDTQSIVKNTRDWKGYCLNSDQCELRAH